MAADWMNNLEKVAARARQEAPLEMDVSMAVLRTLRQPEESSDKPLAFFAAGSLAAACVVAVYTVSLLDTITDPLGPLFQMAGLITL